jgi:repressor LexA
VSVVQYHIEQLEHAGLITRDKGKSRSISPVLEAESAQGVPLLGVIAAGQPIGIPDAETLDKAADRIEISPHITAGKSNVYALQVRGNSMVDAMIGDGDIVIMHHNYDIKNGDVVAAWLKNEQEITLKKIYFEGDRVRLQPCNPYMMPIYQPATNVEVQGKVIGVMRTMEGSGKYS